MMGKNVTQAACVLSAVGAVNWGFVAFTPTNFDLVMYIANIFGQQMVATLLYGAIAASGVYVLASMFSGSISCKC